MYTGSLYACLSSLVGHVDSDTLQGKRFALFAFGGGAAASFFALHVAGSTEEISKQLDLPRRLADMRVVTCEEYMAALDVSALLTVDYSIH